MSLEVSTPTPDVKAPGVPSPSAALVVAVIVGANSRRWLDPCFATLLRSDHGNLRAVYVDNASTDGSAEFVRARFSEVDVVEAYCNVGFACGSNIGIERALRAGAAHVLLLNPDTRTPAGLVRRLAGFLAAQPAYAIVGPLQWDYGTTRLNAWSRHALDNGERNAFHHWDPTLPSEAGPTLGRAPCTLEHAYVQGAALMIQTRVLRELGALDPHYRSFYEEVDLCRRARWAGYRVALLLDAFVEHAGGTDGGVSRYRNFHMTRNRNLYLLTDPRIPLGTAAQLMARWLIDDAVTQRRAVGGTVTDTRELVAAWLSVARSARWARATRRRNARLAGANE